MAGKPVSGCSVAIGEPERILDSTVVQEYAYVYNGSALMQMVVQTTVDDGTPTMDTLYFSYDASGIPMSLVYNGTDYFYTVNLQGDVTAILNTSGTAVVEYTYDAWGRLLSTSGSMANTLGAVNPLTYRGYVYDTETGLYYLQSRYYNPETGRFLNADGYMATGQGLLGNNMFAYCYCNPANKIDIGGAKPGDLFDTMDEAALDFAMCYNEKSIEDKQEYGSAIYSLLIVETSYQVVRETHRFLWWTWTRTYIKPVFTLKVKYSYTKPSIGKNGNSVTPNFGTIYSIVATVHTHANYDAKYNNENFSTGFASDIGWANFFKMDCYVATPGGYLKKYTYANRYNDNGGVSVISDTIPWDPNSPDH